MIINLRWKMYLDFLEAHSYYEQIFVTDTRDVIFQGDVFESFKGYSNCLVYATELVTIGEDREYNYPWLEGLFGKEEADKLSDKKIICAGTLLGSINMIKIFCREVWNVVKNHLLNNFDQGATNYLIHNNLLPIENLIESNVVSGEIFTNGLIKDNKIGGGKILRGDGGVPAVVHQYDRHQDLVRLVDKIYRDKNFRIDERFNDMRSVIELMTSLLKADRIDEGSRIFLKKFFDSADFSLHGDALMKLWSNVLEKPLSQPLKLLELALQYAATSVKNFSGYFLQTLCNNLKRAKELGHPVDPEFKNYAAGILLGFANHNLNLNQLGNCFWCIKEMEELNLPPNKNFYLLVAKVNRIAGKKDEALAAYKKVLELS
ncbi:MAG: hypothetical protein IKO74_12365 [Selenomonadaceae bacterium]|nr:hypothetical protein [Selenomonadaceae bacterium]